VTMASDLILGVSTPLNITSGTLDQGPTFSLRAGAITVGLGGVLQNLGTGDLTLGGNLANSGTVRLNGNGAACGNPNPTLPLLIRSTSAGVQRAWSGSGTFTVVDADIMDQGGTAPVNTIRCVNSGGNGANFGFSQICGTFFTVTPCRVFDTRLPADAPALTAGVDRLVQIEGNCAIPSTATAVSANVTVTLPTAAGYLSLYPGGAALPLVSTINFLPGQTRANNAVIPLGPTGNIAVRYGTVVPGTVEVIVDVNGYFE